MEQIGWSLVKDGLEVQHWGIRRGECAGLPTLIKLPNGDHVHCPAPGAIQEWQLVPRMSVFGDGEAPSFDGQSVLVFTALATLKAELVAKVKAKAASIRDAVRTPGKDMVYSEKKDQAHAVLAMGRESANGLPNNGAQSFPLLAGTVGIEAPTLYDLAQLVWSKYEAWNALSFYIERAEASAVKSISDASNAAEAQAAYEGITWPSIS